eukprot:2155150-Prymnesium_polylepis.2
MADRLGVCIGIDAKHATRSGAIDDGVGTCAPSVKSWTPTKHKTALLLECMVVAAEKAPAMTAGYYVSATGFLHASAPDTRRRLLTADKHVLVRHVTFEHQLQQH